MRILSGHECHLVSGGTTRDEFVADLKTQDGILQSQFVSSQRDNIAADDTSPNTLITPILQDWALDLLHLPKDPSTNADTTAAAINEARYDQMMISLMDEYGVTDTSQHTFDLNTDANKIDFVSLKMSDFDMIMMVTPTEMVVVEGSTPPTAGQLQDALTQANADVGLADFAGNLDEIDVDNGSDCCIDDGESYTYGDDYYDDGEWNWAEDWIPEDGSTW